MAKKNGEIRWKKSIGNINYSTDISEKRILSVGEVLLAIVCVLAFVCSARIMLSDVFEWGKNDGVNLMIAAAIITLVCVIMEVAKYTDVKWRRLIQWGVLIGGIISCACYLLYKDNGEHVLAGLEKIGALYASEWDYYYNDSEKNPVTDVKYILTALNFLTIVLSYVLMWLAKISKKNIIAAVLPMAIFMAELLVGFTPKIISVTLLFLAVVLSSDSKWKKVDFCHAPGKKRSVAGKIHGFSWIIACVCTIIICGAINITGKAFAWETVENADDIVDYMKDFVEGIPDWSVWDLFLGNNDAKEAELTNDSPEYEEIEVIQMKMNQYPVESIYLRGFYADIYDDGVWERDIDEFEDACDDAGYDEDKISEQIISMGLNKIELADTYAKQADIELIYLEPADTRAYASYFSRISHEDISTEGDGRYIKSRSLDKYSYTSCIQAKEYTSLVFNSFIYNQKEPWEEWYEDYVTEHYLDVPKGMSNVKEIAETIKEESFYEEYLSFSDDEELNVKRIFVAEAVALWMEQNTTYSLELPELPRGADPIEYFLGTSKTGYCMHYASASVMLLRQLGVPARYASGYFVPEESFERTEGLYESSIMDSQAHAWVEMYLNGIGWVPVEVTKGYNASYSGTDVNIQTPVQDDEEEEDRPEENQQEEDESENVDDSQEEQTQETENNTPDGTEPDENGADENGTDENGAGENGSGENSTGGSSSGGNGAGGNGSSGNSLGEDGSAGNGSSVLIGIGSGQSITAIIYDIGKKILPVIVVLLVITIIVCIILRARASYRNKLLNEIRKKRTLRAIRRINRRIYQKLRLTGKVLKTDLRDDGYEKLLVKNYTNVSLEEWKEYMDIVKAAAFSVKDFSEEEMNFCHGVYRRVIRNS